MGQTRPGLDPKELDHLLKQSGFTNIHSRPLPPEPGAKGPALFLTTAQK